MNQLPRVAFVGDKGVGKTHLVKKILGQEEKKYVATLGVEIRDAEVKTDQGKVKFAMIDCAGPGKYEGLGPGYWLGCKLIVIVINEREDSLEVWKKKIAAHVPNVQYIVRKNTCDSAELLSTIVSLIR